MARATYIEAIRQAQMEEMQRDARVFIMGEDIVCNVFGTTTGFTEMFGKERVRDTPISENGFIGASAGAAMVGDPWVRLAIGGTAALLVLTVAARAAGPAARPLYLASLS